MILLDGFDGHAQFYVAVAIHGSQQQFVVWNNPSVVNLLIDPRASYLLLTCPPLLGLFLLYSG